jgi:hypothetical protein
MVVVVLLLGVSACDSTAPLFPGWLDVHVYAGQNGEAGKTIEIRGTGLSQKTDAEGRAVFEVGAGTHTVRAYDINQGGPCCAYVDQHVAVVAGDTTRVDFFDCPECVAPGPPVLDPNEP